MKLRQFFRKGGLWILVAMASHSGNAQDVIESTPKATAFSQRVWYRNYIRVKLHPKWSLDNSIMFGLRDVKHRFSFVQIGVGGTYRFNRFWSTRLGYESTFFRYSKFWRKNYDMEPGVLNSVHFQSFGLNVKRTDNVGARFRLKQTVEGKFFTPRYQKFQTRLRYGVHFGYRKSNLPWRLRPFVSTSLYYYLGGQPVVVSAVEEVDEEEEESLIEEEVVPHGFHRVFSRAGFNFKPFKGKSAPSITVYYAYNREFNFLGNPIHVEQFNEQMQVEKVQLPFNNYGVLGVQLNWFF